MTNPFKQKQRKQVIVKLTSKHHTTFPQNRFKIGAWINFYDIFCDTTIFFSNFNWA
jgi:hypothetical protein